MSSGPPRSTDSDHSDPVSRAQNLFTPFQMALRNQLGELADERMSAKVELIKKIKTLIILENDLEKLGTLNRTLNALIANDEEIAYFDKVLTELVASVIKNATTWRNFKMKPAEK